MHDLTNLLLPRSSGDFWAAVGAVVALVAALCGLYAWYRRNRRSPISQNVVEQYERSLTINWRPIHGALWQVPEVIDPRTRYDYLTRDMIRALYAIGGDRSYIKFTALLRVHSAMHKGVAFCTYSVHASNGEFCRALEDASNRRAEAAIDILENKSKSLQEAYDDNCNWIRDIDGWSTPRNISSSAEIQALDLELDRNAKRVSIRVIVDLQTNVSKYPKHLSTTSELLAWFAAVSCARSGRVFAGHPVWVQENYFLQKLLSKKSSPKHWFGGGPRWVGQAWAPHKCFVSVDDGEKWNYDNPEYDREIVLSMNKYPKLRA